jgi:hypothetical protein
VGFQGPSTIEVEGKPLDLLAVRPDGSAVVVAVDAAACVTTRSEARPLAGRRALTLAGVRCYRIPLQQVDDPVTLAAILEVAGLRL